MNWIGPGDTIHCGKCAGPIATRLDDGGILLTLKGNRLLLQTGRLVYLCARVNRQRGESVPCLGQTVLEVEPLSTACVRVAMSAIKGDKM